jgi:cytochrome P450
MTALPAMPQVPEPRLPFDPPPELERLRVTGQVVKVATPVGLDAWLVSDYAAAREVLGDGRRFSARPGSTAHMMPSFDADSPVDGLFTRLDGPEHIRIRRNFAPQLSHARRLSELRPLVQDVVDDAIDDLAATGGTADLHLSLSRRISTTVIAELVGVEPTYQRLFYELAAVLFNPNPDSKVQSEDLQPIIMELFTYMSALVEDRRANPGDDVVSRMIAHSAADERPLSDWELISANAALFLFGFDVISSRLSGGLLMLLSEPERWRRLVADPELAPTAGEEIVRFLGSPTGLLRVATEDTTVNGQKIAADDYVIVAVQAANRDPALHPDGDVFDMARKPGAHLGYGHGAHACVAQQVARIEITTALRTLATRVPSLRLTESFDGIPVRADSTTRGPAWVPVGWDEVLPRAQREEFA